MIPPFTGRCLCGATTYTCTASPMWQGLCHCESCRRAAAAPYAAFFGMAAGTWAWTGQPPATRESSPGVFRDRCATCGTPMSYRTAGGGGAVDLFAPTLDDPAAFSPEVHFLWHERLPWVAQDEALPHSAAEGGDPAQILDLIRRAFAGMDGRIDPPSSARRLTVDEIAADATAGQVWVIGTPARACVFVKPAADHLYLGKLAVAPEDQRRGLARALIRCAEGQARARGLPALQLSTRIELVENHAAFRALGFQQTGATAHPGFDRPTSLVFRKEL